MLVQETVKNGIYCPGFGDATNGMSVVAKLLLADPQWKGERIVHGAWLVGTWLACLRFGAYVRMPHGSYDPVRLAYHGWKKRLVGPIERFFLRRAAKVLATCAAEREWILAYEPRACVEVVDLKRFFGLEVAKVSQGGSRSSGASAEYRASFARASAPSTPCAQTQRLHLLYLGRRHPLKGVECLEKAVEDMRDVELKVVSHAVGEELEKVWEWCDVLALPTLSENFGLVVAEALERGKRVVTTDGAPVWEGQPGVVYLKGYREGSDEKRVELLKKALH